MSCKHKKKTREWLIRRKKKRMRRLSRRKKNHYSNPTSKQGRNRNRRDPIFMKAPENFSLTENISETVDFFSKVFENIQLCKKGQKIFFDLSVIKNVTPEAIMYLIAIINNVRRLQILEIRCGGNMPLDKNAREIFERVGFYNHVRSTGRIIETKDSERIRISQGKESSGEITSSICDFVNEKINSDTKILTKRLYPMLVELMTNVKQHAYHKEVGTMLSKWYVYAENCEQEIKFIFLDTGLGIPNTIRKNWTERIIDLFGKDKDDPTYIEAALRGDFRTETKQEHRGKGLPEIYNAVTVKESRLTNLEMISGHGKCKVDDTGIIRKEYIERAFEGTLFMWSFLKEGI